MTDYMFEQFMRRLRWRYRQRQIAAWKVNVAAASARWRQESASVPLLAWQSAMALKGMLPDG